MVYVNKESIVFKNIYAICCAHLYFASEIKLDNANELKLRLFQLYIFIKNIDNNKKCRFMLTVIDLSSTKHYQFAYSRGKSSTGHIFLKNKINLPNFLSFIFNHIFFLLLLQKHDTKIRLYLFKIKIIELDNMEILRIIERKNTRQIF